VQVTKKTGFNEYFSLYSERRRFIVIRVYSGRQLLLFGVFCAVLVLVLAGVFGLLKLPGGNPAQSGNAQSNGTEKGTDSVLEVQPVQFKEAGKSIQSAENLNNYSPDELENIEIYKKYNPAVVNITSISFYYNWFLEPVPNEGTGSGSIFDKKGYVLTNYHVVKGADKLQITLADGSGFEGDVVGVDPENDLAVIWFDPKGKELSVIPFGVSENLLVGQKVLAIGNPFALERTLTTGIVSGLGRPVKTDANLVIKEMIQTDASINPGNSGGPLLNSHGEMIGINTMIYSPSGGSIGIGFAVPVNTARRVIPDLIKYGEVRRGWLDAEMVQLFPQLVRYARLPAEQGLLVSELKTGGFAEKAGLKGGDRNRAVRTGRQIIYLGGDIIIEVDGISIKQLADLYSALEDNKPDDVVKVKVIRGNTAKELDIMLSKR
jgi:S1-C subfamily serine protease